MSLPQSSFKIIVHHAKIFLYGMIGIVLIVFVQGCASTGSPSGGPRDVTPPRMDSIRSAQNRQINFRPRQLDFFFDEFIEVRDPIKEVLVSPPLTYIPQVKHRGKKVTFAFDEKEVLRENATYTINFGESVVDFHEGNKLSNFSYVFATGPALDSMTLKGKIIDALTAEPDQEMVVFLYDNLNDSVVAKEKPFYFARPDKTGNFEFQNVKSDTFRLLAIKDENINYKYDLPTEKIALYDSIIILNDSAKYDITLISSLPVPKLKILSYETKTYGKINILYNTRPPSPPVCIIPQKEVIFSSEIIQDSVNVYYETALDSFSVYIYNDTLNIKPKSKQDFMKKSRFQMISTNAGMKVLPSDSLVFNYNFPLKLNPSKNITVSDTIGQLEDVKITTSADKKSIIIRYPWVAGEEYQVSIDSNTIQSFYGHAGDSIGADIKILKPDQTAAISFTFSDLDSTATYIINIQKEKYLVYSMKVVSKAQATLNLTGLVPDRYNVEMFQDVNDNGVWDPGNYWTKTQPEAYKFFKGETVRENKQTDINLSWKTKKNTEIIPESQRLNTPLNIKR
jgi:hypothetical protein